MEADIFVLMAGAVSIAFVHTLLGPDHYLPFVALAKARAWSLRKTGIVTTVCGLGHAVGSIALGFVGVYFGGEISRLMAIEGMRGDWAAWGLIAFGLIYFAWGMRRAHKSKTHTHDHAHADGEIHSHSHTHFGAHAHPHVADDGSVDLKSMAAMTPWALFIIFVLGPCEPLIPLMMFPGAEGAFMGVVMVIGAFTFTTIATMLGVVFIGYKGLEFVSLKPLARYTHAIAGATVSLCGVAITFGL